MRVKQPACSLPKSANLSAAARENGCWQRLQGRWLRYQSQTAWLIAKQLIAIRLSPRLLAALRNMAAKQGKGYQTLIHELLEKAASRAA